jgi:hypothetical protein
MQAWPGVPSRWDVSCLRTRASRIPRRYKACRFAPLSTTSGSPRGFVVSPRLDPAFAGMTHTALVSRRAGSVSVRNSKGSTRARVTRRPCHDQRKPGAPIWNSPPVSRQVIGGRRLGFRLGRRACRGYYDPARLMELAQPTAGCQRPTGLDPLRSFPAVVAIRLRVDSLARVCWVHVAATGALSQTLVARQRRNFNNDAFLGEE